MPILHIVNGDSTREGLERSSVPGTFHSWSDILHEGPIPANVTPEEWRRIRVGYLASHGYGAEPAIAAQYAREDAALERWREYDEVVFWFEHDLYDQLILIKHLAWMAARRAEGAPQKQPRFSLVCDDTYLGPLKPEQFPALFAMREPITPAQIELGKSAWEAFCSDDPRGLMLFTDEPARELPFLAGALHRHLQEFPSVNTGLARSEDQIVRIAAVLGKPSPDDLFATMTRGEERIFMGDASFWTIVKRLSSGPQPLLATDVQERRGRLPVGTVTATHTGREVLLSRADNIALNGIDRWLGGVHLTPSRCWRWDGARLIAE